MESNYSFSGDFFLMLNDHIYGIPIEDRESSMVYIPDILIRETVGRQ